MKDDHDHEMTVIREERWKEPPIKGSKRHTYVFPTCRCGAISRGGDWYERVR